MAKCFGTDGPRLSALPVLSPEFLGHARRLRLQVWFVAGRPYIREAARRATSLSEF